MRLIRSALAIVLAVLLTAAQLPPIISVPPYPALPDSTLPPAPPPPLPGMLHPAAEIPLAPQLVDADQFLYLPLITHGPDPRARSDARALYLTEYLPAESVPMGWTNGSVDACSEGSPSAAYRSAALARINYFRVMAGVPPLDGLRADYNSKAQAAALITSANGQISFNPPTSWKCYTTARRDGAAVSNMLLDANGPAAVSRYMDDSAPGSQVFHRRYLLYPQTRWTGLGDVPATIDPNTQQVIYRAANALVAYDDYYYAPRPATRDEFVAWPPAAYVPYPVVYRLWSFSYPAADFSSASVSVTSSGTNVPLTRTTPVNGYGENTLVWQIGGWTPWPKPAADIAYQVTIRGARVNGQSKDFTYTVIVFDPAK